MSRKVFVLAPGEDWIVDRFVHEWNQDNSDISTKSVKDADVVWAMADWCFDKIMSPLLCTKKVLVTVHHIVPEKFTARDRMNFQIRDDIVTAYHVPNDRTANFVKQITKKPIHVIPYWANQNIWKPTIGIEEARNKYGISNDKYIIGSFQRDTEGAGISKGIFEPKLEKGPDLLADAIIALSKKANNYFEIEVVLAGWRRQYIMKRLSEAKIAFKYFERPEQSVINELYQALDLYLVTARHEGGPQALIECGLLSVPVLSRAVGMAEMVLPTQAISNDFTNAKPSVPNVENLLLPNGYKPYRDLIESI
jgi:glycosyltransferase involved in cell wall biosynthesis